MSIKKFELGQVVASQMIAIEMKRCPQFGIYCKALLERHFSGDWGDLEEEDKEANEDALLHDGRILSAYEIEQDYLKMLSSNQSKLWIITEWNRSYTTILFPCEY